MFASATPFTSSLLGSKKEETRFENRLQDSSTGTCLANVNLLNASTCKLIKAVRWEERQSERKIPNAIRSYSAVFIHHAQLKNS